MPPINPNISDPSPKMEISFRFNEANGPVTINVPANVGFTINVKPVGGLVPAVGGGGGVEQVKDEYIKAEIPDPSLKMANPKVFFDMTVDGKPAGRIVMELFADTTPRTAENFRALCTGEKGMGKLGKPLHYKGSIIHRLVPKYMFCGGDLIASNGTGGESIYEDRFFEDENFIRQITGPGFLSMENRGPDTNGSLFNIVMREDNFLGLETVVFGQVIEGLDVLKSIEKEVGKCRGYKPSKPVVIADCGQIS